MGEPPLKRSQSQVMQITACLPPVALRLPRILLCIGPGQVGVILMASTLAPAKPPVTPPVKPPAPPQANLFATAAVIIIAAIAAVVILKIPAPSSPWSQGYDPTGHWLLSTILAALPVIVLLGSLALGHVKAHYAALAGSGGRLADGHLCLPHAGRVWRRQPRSTAPATACSPLAGSCSTSSSCTSSRLSPGASTCCSTA